MKVSYTLRQIASQICYKVPPYWAGVCSHEMRVIGIAVGAAFATSAVGATAIAASDNHAAAGAPGRQELSWPDHGLRPQLRPRLDISGAGIGNWYEFLGLIVM